MPTEQEIDAAHAKASDIGNAMIAAEQLAEEIAAIAKAIKTSEAEIDDASEEAREALGAELVQELKDLSLTMYRLRLKVLVAKNAQRSKANDLDRDYRNAVDAANALEATQ